MAEMSTPFDSMDLETANLILSLQLGDLEELCASSKDKNRDGELSDTQFALFLLEQNLKAAQSVVSDRRMTQSIANAVQADGELISNVVNEEELACGDHTLAHRLNGSNVISEVHLSPENLDEKILSKLAGLYMSENVGRQLYEGTSTKKGSDGGANSPAESSAEVSARRGHLGDTREIQCVACREDKRFFDVIEGHCGHGYCKPCLQELFYQACRDESLFPPRCCREPFELRDVQIFLTKELKDQFERAKGEFDTRDRTYCSRITCSAFIPAHSLEGDTATCSACGTETCTICKSLAHEGDCPDDSALRETLELAVEQGWQRCCACRRLIELDVGCNHMT